MSNGIFAACGFIVPFYTQAVLGFSPVESGLMMLPFAVAFSVAGPLSGRAADKMGSRVLTVAGFVCTSLALLVLASLEVARGDVHPAMVKVAVGMALLGLGSGLFISPNSGVTLDSVPAEKGGSASGLLYCMAFLGSAVGTAYAASLLAAGLRGEGGLATLRDHTSGAAGMVTFVEAQGFVFHSLLAASVVGVVLCALRSGRHSTPMVHAPRH
jgi:MFS family permease